MLECERSRVHYRESTAMFIMSIGTMLKYVARLLGGASILAIMFFMWLLFLSFFWSCVVAWLCHVPIDMAFDVGCEVGKLTCGGTIVALLLIFLRKRLATQT